MDADSFETAATSVWVVDEDVGNDLRSVHSTEETAVERARAFLQERLDATEIESDHVREVASRHRDEVLVCATVELEVSVRRVSILP